MARLKVNGLYCNCGHTMINHESDSGCLALAVKQPDRQAEYFKQVICKCRKYFTKSQISTILKSLEPVKA